MKKTAGFVLFIAAVFLTLTFAFAEAEGLPPFLSGQNHDRPTGLSEPIAGETVIDETQYQGANRPIRVLRLSVR